MTVAVSPTDPLPRSPGRVARDHSDIVAHCEYGSLARGEETGLSDVDAAILRFFSDLRGED